VGGRLEPLSIVDRLVQGGRGSVVSQGARLHCHEPAISHQGVDLADSARPRLLGAVIETPPSSKILALTTFVRSHASVGRL